jgi:hypothetical protein
MDNDRAGDSDTRPLPSYDRPPVHRRPDYGWYGADYGPPPSYAQPIYIRDSGIRGSRRTMTWTAAALIATVAATTGYLAHAIPVGSSHAKNAAHSRKAIRSGNSSYVAPSGPSVTGPVGTSGGSGVAGSHGDN